MQKIQAASPQAQSADLVGDKTATDADEKYGLNWHGKRRARQLAGLDVYAVSGGVLLACLAPAITSADVEALAGGIIAWHQELAPAGESTCVFRDSAFADDVAKTNLTAILAQSGIENVRSL